MEASEDAAAISSFDSESPVASAEPSASEASEEKAAEPERVALTPALWADPDVRWLTGVHEDKGHAYLVREQYEELLWWLLMPSLLRLAGAVALDRPAIREMGKIVDEALASAEAAGYRIDALLGPPAEADKAEAADAKEVAEVEMQAVEPEEAEVEAADVPVVHPVEPS
jgi:hypothetical protein